MFFTRILFSVCLFGLVFLSSCSKDETPTGNTTTSTISAKIDGADWDGTYAGVASNINKQILISGQNNKQEIVLISLFGVTTVGTYTVGGTLLNQNTAQYSVNMNPPSVWSTAAGTGTGTVTISKLTATDIEGTFSFDAAASPFTGASGTKKVTEGKFSIKLTII